MVEQAFALRAAYGHDCNKEATAKEIFIGGKLVPFMITRPYLVLGKASRKNVAVLLDFVPNYLNESVVL